MSGEGQDNVTVLGPRTFKTPVFFECGLKVQYTIPIRSYYKAQVYAGVQNLFDSYQDDFDLGHPRDSAYIYGPMVPRSYFAGVRLSSDLPADRSSHGVILLTATTHPFFVQR